MLRLKGLVPTGVRHLQNEARLQWNVDGRIIETDFDRFRPVGLNSRNARELRVTWRDLGDLSMTDAFFDRTLAQAARSPITSMPFQTSRDTLAQVARQSDALPFSGAVFHMGRTGSTLVHRLLGCTGKVQSLSEIVLVDRALAMTAHWTEQDRNAVLQDLMAAHQRPRRPNERQFVTKMAAATLWLPFFRAAFPSVPWVFVYREPIEVMVSGMRAPTGNIKLWRNDRVKAARRLGMPAVSDPDMTPEEFSARLMRRVCRAALDAARQGAPGQFLAVHYSRLPDAIWETIAPHFGIQLTEADCDRMREEARFSAKKIAATEFKPDSETKRQEATPLMKRFADRIVGPLIDELKELPQA